MVGKILRRRSLIATCRDVTTPVLKVGRENLHVIAGAAGQDLDHRAVVPDAEELEHLKGMSGAVARHVGGAAMGRCDELRKRALVLRLRVQARKRNSTRQRRKEQSIYCGSSCARLQNRFPPVLVIWTVISGHLVCVPRDRLVSAAAALNTLILPNPTKVSAYVCNVEAPTGRTRPTAAGGIVGKRPFVNCVIKPHPGGASNKQRRGRQAQSVPDPVSPHGSRRRSTQFAI